MVKIAGLTARVVVIVLCLLILAPKCFANAAEPPSILIIVPDAPADLEVSIGSGDAGVLAEKIDKVIEVYYVFYSRHLENISDYTIKAAWGGSTYELPLEKPLKTYHNVYTLDLEQKRLIPGKLLSRSVCLISLRVVLTLVLEGIVFWLFGFRQKKSWMLFLAVNLITQGLLNIWLNGLPPLSSYPIVSLVMGEFFVIFAELMAFIALVKERQRIWTVLYVIVANFASLYAGGYIITRLPL